MKTMFKAIQWSTHIEEVQVIKDTGKTITYEVDKIIVSVDLGFVKSGDKLKRKELKQTDWYCYCDTMAEAKAWLLMCANNSRAETLLQLERQNQAIAEIEKIKIY